MHRAVGCSAATLLLCWGASASSSRSLQGEGTLLSPWPGFAPAGSAVPTDPAYLVAAGSTAAAETLFPCRWNVGDGSYLSGTTRGLPAPGAPCSVPIVANKSASLATPSEPLLANARLGWFAGDTLPIGVTPVLSGMYKGVPSYMCRGRNAVLAAAGVDWVPGTTTMAAVTPTAGVVCQIGFNGQVNATFTASSIYARFGVFQYLVAMPPGATTADFAAVGVTPASAGPPSPSPSPVPPSASRTPSVTPSTSASATGSDSAPPRNTAAWFSRAPDAEGLPAAQIVGVEDRNVIFVCRGGLANGDLVPGKYESVWQWCFVPINGTEVRVRWRRRRGSAP